MFHWAGKGKIMVYHIVSLGNEIGNIFFFFGGQEEERTKQQRATN
jgi:hypothetical protein